MTGGTIVEYAVIGLVFLLGLCIGSFLNVCIFRIPNEESIVFPASHCTKCNYNLRLKDLIPVFSYVFLKGKCANCGEKISIQYPLIELLNGILYVLIYLKYGISIETLSFILLSSIMIVVGIIDLKTKFVYSSTTVIGGAIGLVMFILKWIQLERFPKENLIGMLIGGGIIALIVFITHGMGEGDIEIAAVSGLFLGTKLVIFMLFSSFIIGAIAAIIIVVTKNKKGKDEIPFGPYLAIGTVISIFLGNKIVEWYLNFL